MVVDVEVDMHGEVKVVKEVKGSDGSRRFPFGDVLICRVNALKSSDAGLNQAKPEIVDD